MKPDRDCQSPSRRSLLFARLLTAAILALLIFTTSMGCTRQAAHEHADASPDEIAMDSDSQASAKVDPIEIRREWLERGPEGKRRARIVVLNRSHEPLSDLHLEETLLTEEVAWDEPRELAGAEEPSLEWSIPSLEPGQEWSTDYELDWEGPVFNERIVASVGDDIVAMKEGTWALESDDFAIAPEPQVAVFPFAFEYDFVVHGHHLEHHKLNIDDTLFDPATAEVSWRTNVRYSDENDDDEYWWAVSHGIIAVQDGHVARGSATGLEGIRKGVHAGSYQSNELVGLEAATVALGGWYFNWKGSVDHHIEKIGLHLENVAFDPATGEITWYAQAFYHDESQNDPFWWGYDWIVIGVQNGSIANQVGFVGQHPIEDPSLVGYETHGVLPQGWLLSRTDGDEHVTRTMIGRGNIFPSPDLGLVEWKSYGWFNLREGKAWTWNAILGTDDAGFAERRWHGAYIHDGNGGKSHGNFSMTLLPSVLES